MTFGGYARECDMMGDLIVRIYVEARLISVISLCADLSVVDTDNVNGFDDGVRVWVGTRLRHSAAEV